MADWNATKAKVTQWVAKSRNWKSGKYPDLHPEEIAGRATFLKAVSPPFLPWPTDPFRSLCTMEAIEEIERGVLNDKEV